jgi:signal transduction histidine kinase
MLFRSLLVQFVLLIVLLTLLVVGLLVIPPIVSLLGRVDSLMSTQALVISELLLSRESERGLVETLENSDLIAEVADANKNLRIYFGYRGESYQYGGPPTDQTLDSVQLNTGQLNPLLPESGSDEHCPYSGAELHVYFEDELGLRGLAVKKECGEDSYYYEVSGIEQPVPQASSWGLPYPAGKILMERLKGPVFSIVGFMAIVALVIGLGFRPVRRLSRITHSFDPETINAKLPTNGLPLEILPLVEAVNALLDKVESDRERKQFFLATAAHEMRTPLTLIRIRLEEMLDEDIRSHLRSDVRRLSSLVEDLLRLLNVSSRGDPQGCVDLVDLARRVVADHAPVAIEAAVDIGMEAGVDSVIVRGDDALLFVAVGNLVDNAISFSKPGDTVDVAVSPEGAISVRDRGPGVPVDSRYSLFEPFAKYPPNRKGHGLGLAIVAAIADLHGGVVRIEDAAGGGAIFVLQLTVDENPDIGISMSGIWPQDSSAP